MRSPACPPRAGFFIPKKQQGGKLGTDSEDKLSPSSPRAIYGTIFTLASALAGSVYYQQADPSARADPFTGAQGEMLRKELHDAQEEIDQLEDYVELLAQRGPVDVRTGQKENAVLIKDIRERLIEIKSKLIDIRAQQQEFEALIRSSDQAHRDHFRETQK